MSYLRNITRWSGLLTIAGSIIWICFGSALGSMPVFIPGGPYRESGKFTGWLALGLLLIVIGSAGLHFHYNGHPGKLGLTGWVMSLVGAILWGISALVPASYTDTAIMPLLVIPGFLGATVGFLLAGIAILRRRTLPPWVGALLILASIALLIFNDQYGTVWTIVPFGVIWIVLGGYSLFKGLGKPTAALS